MKKRILAAIIALALVLGLTACGKESGGNNGGNKTSSVITIHSGGKEVSELSALKGQKVDIEAVFGDFAERQIESEIIFDRARLRFGKHFAVYRV